MTNPISSKRPPMAPPRRRVTRLLSFETTPAPASKPASTDETNQHKQVQLASSPSTIDVVLRIRPFNDAELMKGYESSVLPSTNDTILKMRPKVADKHPPGIKQAGRAVFRFSNIFHENSSQEAVFERTTLPLISHLFRGESAVVFAYGVTCSGKTFTIQGTPDAPGILPRALDVIINSIAVAKGDGLAQDSVVSDEVAQLTDDVSHKRRLCSRTAALTGNGTTTGRSQVNHDSNYIDVDPNAQYSIYASYLEIYNDLVFDLFDKSAVTPIVNDTASPTDEDSINDDGDKQLTSTDDDDDFVSSFPSSGQTEYRTSSRLHRPPLKLKARMRTVSGGGLEKEVYAEGQTEVRVKSVVDIERLLEFGCNNRTVAHTRSNSSSSRSHAIFEITLKQEVDVPPTTGGGGGARRKRMQTTSRLQIVDLAGSEKLTKANHSANRAQESRQINTSLMNLSRCLETMRKNQIQARNNPDAKPRIVPFRESKLTRLLQRGLSTGCAVMVTTMSPTLEDADETIHTLRNTAIAREIKIKPSQPQRVLMDVTSNNSSTARSRGTKHDADRKSKRKVLSEVTNKSVGTKSRTTATKAATQEKNVEKERYQKEIEELKTKLRNSREQLDVFIDEKETMQQRISKLERIAKLAEDAFLESNQDREKLYRENERLREKLAHLEGKAQSLEYELRIELGEQMEEGVKKLQERYESHIHELRSRTTGIQHQKLPPVLENPNAEVETFKRRVMRTSSAAFASMTRELQDEDGSSDSLSEEELEEDETIYVEEDSSDDGDEALNVGEGNSESEEGADVKYEEDDEVTPIVNEAGEILVAN